MKLFLDTADIEQIKPWVETGIIDGITTNPSSMSQVKDDPIKIAKKLSQLLPDAVINVEVTEESPNKVYEQAHRIADIAENIAVKIPCELRYYKTIHQLVSEDISINITLVFTTIQALCMAKLEVDYISPFIGRLDDIDLDGVQLIRDIRTIFDMYFFETEILAASIRSVRHLHEAMLAGADIATLSPKILAQATEHPLTDQGLKKFLDDWHAAGKKNI